MLTLQKIIKNEDGIYTSKKFDNSTNLVKAFYKNHPFPNYQGKENKAKLIELRNNNLFLKRLSRTSVLEKCYRNRIRNFSVI